MTSMMQQQVSQTNELLANLSRTRSDPPAETSKLTEDTSLRQVVQAKVGTRSRTFKNPFTEDVRTLWQDWGRHNSLHNDGRGMTRRDQLDALRNAMQETPRKDLLDTLDTPVPLLDGEYEVIFGDVAAGLAAGDHDGVL